MTDRTIYNHEGLELVMHDDESVSIYHEGERFLTMCDWELRAMVKALDSTPVETAV